VSKKLSNTMKKLLQLFPVLALLLGVSFAFANAPSSDALAQTKRANQNGTWVDITGKVLGTDYRCPANSIVCTQMFDSNGNPIAGTEVLGTYTVIP
jgi:hypothetical protein